MTEPVDQHSSSPQPLREAVPQDRLAKALAAFVGACGAAAAVTVVTMAVDSHSLKAQSVPVPGGIGAQTVQLQGKPATTRLTTTTSAPATAPATQPTSEPVQLMGVIAPARIIAPIDEPS